MSYRVIQAVTVDQMAQDLEKAEREGYTYVGALAGSTGVGRTGPVVIMHCREGRITSGNLGRIVGLLKEAVATDGGHHKQWYLEQIGAQLEVALPEHEEGIAP